MNDTEEKVAEVTKPRKRRRRRHYKAAIQSRTIAAALGIIAVNLAALGGWAVSAENASIVVEATMTIAGAGYVIWRRFHTRARVRGLLTASKPGRNGYT